MISSSEPQLARFSRELAGFACGMWPEGGWHMGCPHWSERPRRLSLLRMFGPALFWVAVMVGLMMLRANNGR